VERKIVTVLELQNLAETFEIGNRIVPNHAKFILDLAYARDKRLDGYLNLSTLEILPNPK
jgi:hypothetical protein